MLIDITLYLCEALIIALCFPMAFRPHTLNRSIFNPSLYNRVLDIWFEGLPRDAKVTPPTVNERWFQGPPEIKRAFDEKCRQEFSHSLEAVNPQNYPILTNESSFRPAAPFINEINSAGDDGEKTRRTLSLILLFDQIPRNLYRTMETLPLVYNQYDPIALGIARHMLTMKPRPDLHESVRHMQPWRMWFYLPLMHSEDITDHQSFMQIYNELKTELLAMADKDPAAKEAVISMQENEKYERIHYEILEKFGRYPHRNSCLGRESTKEETEYLKNGGMTFGVKG